MTSTTGSIAGGNDFLTGDAGRRKHTEARRIARVVRLFGLDVTDTTLDAAADWIVERARFGQNSQIAFLNAHCVNVMYRDRLYRGALGASDRIFADGSGVRMAARAAGVALTENVNGTDMLPVLCRKAAASRTSMYFLGGHPGIASLASERMASVTPGLQIAGSHHGYLSDPAVEAAAIADINASGASILLVGFGVPMQETWIARNRHRLKPAVIIGVGGLFDYYSGRISRAPLPLRRLGVEWAWRLAMEPRRLARRYLLGNAEFLVRLALMRLLAPVDFQQS